jgi:hypothetical protein
MQPAKISDLNIVFGNVVTVALTLAGISVLVMFVVGGLGFIMAGGDKEATQKAQRTLSFAIGGLVLTVSAWIIMSLLGSFLGLDFATFTLCLDPAVPC